MPIIGFSYKYLTEKMLIVSEKDSTYKFATKYGFAITDSDIRNHSRSAECNKFEKYVYIQKEYGIIERKRCICTDECNISKAKYTIGYLSKYLSDMLNIIISPVTLIQDACLYIREYFNYSYDGNVLKVERCGVVTRIADIKLAGGHEIANTNTNSRHNLHISDQDTRTNFKLRTSDDHLTQSENPLDVSNGDISADIDRSDVCARPVSVIGQNLCALVVIIYSVLLTLMKQGDIFKSAASSTRTKIRTANSATLAPYHILLPWLAVSSFVIPVVCSDNFALLSGTLRTYQRAGCDEEVVTLNCPSGTSISIQFAQYGKSAPSTSLCPPLQPDTRTGRRVAISGYLTNALAQNVTCLWSSALQYSLLQTVVEACQKKQQCKFHPSTKTFGGDPCPGVRKYVEVAYKCRPFEFLSKVACENDVIQLRCEPHFRLAIYSASYGRTEYESVHCPQPQGVAEETCLVSYAAEAVMHVCHGKRHCTLAADAATFGNPCRPASRMYLKVVYTCVPRNVLKEMYDGPLEDDELEATATIHDMEDDYDKSTSSDPYIHRSIAHPPISRSDINNRHIDNFTKDSPQVTSTGIPLQRKTKDMITSTVGKSVPNTMLNPKVNNQYSHPTQNVHQPYPTRPTMYNRYIPTYNPNIPYTSNNNNNNRQKEYRVPQYHYPSKYHTPTSSSSSTATETTKEMQGDDISDEMNVLFGDKDDQYGKKTIPDSKSTEGGSKLFGFITDWMNAFNVMAHNQERFYLYIILSATAGIILCTGLIIGRLIIQRRRANQDDKSTYQTNTSNDHTLPNGFNDDISDINDDIVLATPLPVPTSAIHSISHGPDSVGRNSMVAVVGYGDHTHIGHHHHPMGGPPPQHQGTFHTIRRGVGGTVISDDAPRGLARAPDSHYYYG